MQPREHGLQDGDEFVLARGGCRPRLEFSLQRVPVDPFVVEIGIDAVEGGPELIELAAEIAGRGGRRDWLIVRSTGGCDEQTAEERENLPPSASSALVSRMVSDTSDTINACR